MGISKPIFRELRHVLNYFIYPPKGYEQRTNGSFFRAALRALKGERVSHRGDNDPYPYQCLKHVSSTCAVHL